MEPHKIALICVGIFILLAVAGFAVWLILRRPLPYIINEKFLTPSEKEFYFLLRDHTPPEIVICPKVRLADILAVDCDEKKYMMHFNKIARKHVDFLLCDASDMQMLCAVELDDSSHELKERQERDKFVNRAFAAAGLDIIHIPLKSEFEDEDFLFIEDYLQSLE